MACLQRGYCRTSRTENRILGYPHTATSFVTMGASSSTSKGNRPGQSGSCKACRAILSQDIQLPLQASLTPSHGTAGILLSPSLGTRREISSRTSCKLCFPFLHLTDILGGDANPDEPLELRAFPFSLSWPIYAHAFAQHQVAKGHLPDACLFACRKGAPPTNYDVRKALESRITTGRLAILTSSPNTSGQPLAPSRLREFSVKKAKSWIETCLAEHRTLCGDGLTSPRIAVRGMKVIDCETLEIKPTAADMAWIALSYVWRLAVPNIPASSIISNLPTDSTTLRLPDTIPALIVDAMTVVKGLGYRYLWVDRYCINQKDTAEVKDQIAQMDRIYRGADLTIIAAGDYNGLGGVGEDTITKRPTLKAVNFGSTMALYETDPNPIAEVRRSPWFSRGWTFQEAILSRRRLFFTPSQALFECATGTRCEMGDLGERTQRTAAHITAFSLEALVYPEIPRLTQLLGSAAATNLPPDLQNAAGIPLDEYLEEASALLLLYRSKQLTVESDTLDAFSGVLRVFEETPYQISHVQGIPCPQRNAREDGADLETLQQRAFALGLVWAGQGSRRPEFPSWTWAGWDTSLRRGLMPVGKALGRFEGNFTSFINIANVGCKCGRMNVSLQSAAAAGGGDHTLQNLEVEGRAIPLSLLALRKHGNGSSYLEARGPDELVYASETYHFPSNLSPEALFAGFTDGTLVGLALGEEARPVSRSLYVLVVEPKGLADGRTVGERKDLVLFIRSKKFSSEEPLFQEASGLQTIRLMVS